MRAAVLLPLLVCFGMAGAKLPPNLLQRYSQKMAFETCFGKQNMMDLQKKIMDAATACWNVTSRSDEPSLYLYDPGLATMVKETIYHFQVHPENLIRGPLSPEDFRTGEQQRGPEFFGVMQCTMNKLGYTNSDGSVNYAFWRNWLRSMFADGSREVLLSELLKGVDQCKQLSELEAQLENNKYSLISVQPGLFNDCMRDVKIRTCIMQDIKDQLGPFISEDGGPNKSTMTLYEAYAVLTRIF